MMKTKRSDIEIVISKSRTQSKKGKFDMNGQALFLLFSVIYSAAGLITESEKEKMHCEIASVIWLIFYLITWARETFWGNDKKEE